MFLVRKMVGRMGRYVDDWWVLGVCVSVLRRMEEYVDEFVDEFILLN